MHVGGGPQLAPESQGWERLHLYACCSSLCIMRLATTSIVRPRSWNRRECHLSLPGSSCQYWVRHVPDIVGARFISWLIGLWGIEPAILLLAHVECAQHLSASNKISAYNIHLVEIPTRLVLPGLWHPSTLFFQPAHLKSDSLWPK